MVNDHSSDGSDQVCAGIAAVDERFKLLQSPHLGIAAALNYGISQASGVYIACMDGSDLCMQNRFARQIGFLKENPDISFLGTFAHHINETGEIGTSIEFPEDDLEIKAHLDRGQISFLHPSMMIRRRALLDLGGYRVIFSICQDYDLWLRAQDRYSFANLPEHLVACRNFPPKDNLTDSFWKYFYATELAEISVQQCRAGKRDPLEQMHDEFDLDAIEDQFVRDRLMPIRQDYYCNKKAFVDRKPLNSMDIEQIKVFLLKHREKFNKKALAHAFGVLFDQAMRIDDTESAATLFELQRDISKSRHLKSLLAKPNRLVQYAVRKGLEDVWDR
ncbi:hypothetical protein GCM10007094_32350 [Pseudovibrio japonicus]|uniref:Glycosyltransferase 2-like domain-containing protein n=2 Tax=Pseudovibrio japonicus TaxID=366534 RepID=A0ABQ3EHY5_9HYPH|nr:hypothetical protein GCM10007094_32350 [Pseudovibrio japonicus]